MLDAVQYADGSGGPSLNMLGGGSLHPATHETVDARLHFARQDGKTVFKRAVVGMAEAAAEIIERNGLTGRRRRLARAAPGQPAHHRRDGPRMGLPPERVMINIERYGNTTAGTLPLCLADYESQLRRGDTVVLAAFGGGFTWGATLLKWAYDGDGDGLSGAG